MGVEINENLIFMDADNQIKVAESVKSALEQGADGILCMDDVICGMCLGSLREKKVHIPSQTKVVSMYDSKNLEDNNPLVASVKFGTVLLGNMESRKFLEFSGEQTEKEEASLSY